MCKQLKNRGVFSCWQLVAPIWTYVALKSENTAKYLPPDSGQMPEYGYICMIKPGFNRIQI